MMKQRRISLGERYKFLLAANVIISIVIVAAQKAARADKWTRMNAARERERERKKKKIRVCGFEARKNVTELARCDLEFFFLDFHFLFP